MVAGILLAAGASRRYGSDKLLAPLEGKPVVRWSAEALRRVVDALIVVTGSNDAAIRGALGDLATRFVTNARAADGMGTSVAAGIAALDPDVDAALIALGDQPRPSARGIEAVLQRYASSHASIVAPRFRGVPGHPVLFARSVFPELLALTGDQGARRVVERAPARVAIVGLDEVPPSDVDVPADLDRLSDRH